jgi:hypothetical protein
VWLRLNRVNLEADGPSSWGPWVFDDSEVQSLEALLSLWTCNFKAKEDASHRVVSDFSPHFIFVLGPASRWVKIYWQWIAREGKQRRTLNPVVVQPGHDWGQSKVLLYRTLGGSMGGPYEPQHSVGLKSPSGEDELTHRNRDDSQPGVGEKPP